MAAEQEGTRTRLWIGFALALVACTRGEPDGHRRGPAAPTRVAPAAADSAAPNPAGTRTAAASSTEAAPAALPSAPQGLQVAIVAGGCFWGMEEILRAIPGVVDTEVGYAGGTTSTPTYDQVHHGDTGHAESVMITFDPARLSYPDLLENWFFRAHDPTTRNRQGNDVGSQYRSAIFYLDEQQRRTAQEVKARVDGSGHWKRPVVTEIVAAVSFTPAEDYHQDYLQRHPDGYTCHYLRDQ